MHVAIITIFLHVLYTITIFLIIVSDLYPFSPPSLWFKGLSHIEDIIMFITKAHLTVPLFKSLPSSDDFWTLLQITALLCDCFNYLK